MNAVLDKAYHARIMADAESLCEIANIPRSMLQHSAKEYCAPKEIDWLVNYPVMKDSGRGLVLVGEHHPGPETKMMAMAGALLRNYIDARVVPLNTLLTSIEKGYPLDPTVMLIPNLFVKYGGKTLPSWQMQQVYDLLLQRHVAQRPTVLYVEDLNALEIAYGQVLAQHIRDNYTVSGA